MIGTDALIAALRAFIPQALAVTGTPGLNIALARDGGVVWEEGFGWANIASKRPMTPETTARVGSITKLYTAVAVMQLAERGVLDLYRPVVDYLPDLPVVNPLGERHVTAYDLLTFRSGLATDTAEPSLGVPAQLRDYLQREYGNVHTPEYGRHRARWAAKVGHAYQYSNLGVATLGYLIAVANPAGLSYPAYIRREIFDPLGMSASAFATPDEDLELAAQAAARLSTGYARFARTYIPTPPVLTDAGPAGGLIATPGDHLRFLLALLGDGEWDQRRILAPPTVHRMLTPQVKTDDLFRDIDSWNGIMVQIAHLGEPRRFFGHTGGFPWGWYHDSRAYPELGFAMVAFTNKYDAIRWNNPSADLVPSLVAEFVADLLIHTNGERTDAARSWDWKASYLMGALLAERCSGLFGMMTSWSSQAIDEMVKGTRALPGEPDELWNPDGFRAGVEVMVNADVTPNAIRRLVAGDEFGVPGRELPLIALGFGRRGGMPLPMAYFARPSP